MDNPELVPRPRAGCWFLAIPILLTIGVLVGYAVMLGYGWYGRPATGDRVRMTYQGCPAALDLVRARVDEMGLGDPAYDPTADGFVVTARLPADAAVAARIPVTLAMRGVLQITSVERSVAVVDPVVLQLAVFHTAVAGPVTNLRLDATGAKQLKDAMEAHPSEHVAFVLDRQTVDTVYDTPAIGSGQIEVRSKDGDGRAQISAAAERAVVLSHGPLPCDVRLVSAEKVP